MHIHIKPFRFILSNKTQNQNKERSVKNKPKKVLSLFDSYSHNPVLGPSFLVTNHNSSQICHYQRTTKEKPKKKNQLCILGFLVRVDVYPIHLHLKIFLGTHEPYFAYASFNKMKYIYIYIYMSLFSVRIGIISFGSLKLKLRHFNAKLTSMPSSLVTYCYSQFQGS